MLDEATSALDSESESIVQAALDRVRNLHSDYQRITNIFEVYLVNLIFSMKVCPPEILLIVTTPVQRNSCKMPLLAEDA